MIPGGEVYQDIQRRIKAAEQRLEDVRANLRRVSGALEDNRTSESKDLSSLARIRFNELEGERVVRGLDSADHEVLTLLEHKRAAFEAVEQELAGTQRDQMTLESQRTRYRADLDEALARYARELEVVQKKLAANEAYLFQRTRTERATEQAGGAAEKATQSETDRATKGKPYEDDRLFSYLWERRYRFPEYRANLITRALDKWVAGLCGYDNAHRDYAMLLEIPVRLREHANALQAVAREQADVLVKIEDEAHEAAGLSEHQEAIEAREENLRSCDETLAGAEERMAELRVDRARFDADEDEHTLQAIAVLAVHMAREPIASLRDDALRSQTPADDAVVANISQLRSDRGDLEPELESHREEQAAALKSLESLEQVRGTFRKRSYDANGSVFEDGPRTSSVLGGLLRGVLVAAEVLADMKSQQRFEGPSWRGGGGGGSSSRGSSGGSSGGFRTGDWF